MKVATSKFQDTIIGFTQDHSIYLTCWHFMPRIQMAQPLSNDEVLGKVCSKTLSILLLKIINKVKVFKDFYLRYTNRGTVNPDNPLHNYNMNCILNKIVQLVKIIKLNNFYFYKQQLISITKMSPYPKFQVENVGSQTEIKVRSG